MDMQNLPISDVTFLMTHCANTYYSIELTLLTVRTNYLCSETDVNTISICDAMSNTWGGEGGAGEKREGQERRGRGRRGEGGAGEESEGQERTRRCRRGEGGAGEEREGQER